MCVCVKRSQFICNK